MGFAELLEHYGVWCKSSWGQFKTNCPFDDHPDSSPSFSVNIDLMVWNCKGCGRVGNHITLVAQLEEISNAEARLRIAEVLGGDLTSISPGSSRESSFLPEWARHQRTSSGLLPDWVCG